MATRSSEEEEFDFKKIPLLFRPFVFVFLLVVLVLFIAFTILTLGIFLPDEKEKKTDEGRQKGSIEEKLRVSLLRKNNRLRKVLLQIDELQLIRNRILRRERRIFISVRLVIAGALVGINYVFLQAVTKECPLTEQLDDIANFNACILLGYSLAGYVLYGTVGRLTSAMKAKTTQILRRKHIRTFSELQLLKEEETQLKKDIGYLKMRLEEFE